MPLERGARVSDVAVAVALRLGAQARLLEGVDGAGVVVRRRGRLGREGPRAPARPALLPTPPEAGPSDGLQVTWPMIM